MHDIVKTSSSIYFFGAIWLLALLGTAWLATTAMDPLYTTLGLDPLARTMASMVIASLAATAVTGLGVKSLRRARPATH